jgi:hypothetical protein
MKKMATIKLEGWTNIPDNGDRISKGIELGIQVSWSVCVTLTKYHKLGAL